MDANEAAQYVNDAFVAMISGDPKQQRRYWHPDLTWYGLHRSGAQREYQGLEGLFAALAEPPPVVESLGEEPLDVWPIGDGVIAARIRGQRRAVATGEEIASDFLFAVRVEDGLITRAIDLVDASLADFWRRATAAATDQ